MDLEKVKQNLLAKEDRRKKEIDKTRSEIQALLGRCDEIFKKHGVAKAYLYGSMAKGSIHRSSDVDIAVEGDIDFRAVLRLYTDLTGILGRPVDVRVLEDLPFREKVLKEGILFYDRKAVSSEE